MLDAHLDAFFTRVCSSYPHSPFRLLTSLAEGADRLAAHAAIRAGGQLVAVLPFSCATYRQDFTRDESQREFEALLHDPATVQCVVVPELAGASHRFGATVARDLQYELAGLYVARHSNVLIALWDGADNGGVGGTAHIVRFRLTGALALEPALVEALEAAPEPFAPPRRPMDPPDTGVVLHVPTLRAPGGGVAEATSSVDRAGRSSDQDAPRFIAPDDVDSRPAARERYLARTWAIWRRIDAFNAEQIRWARAQADASDTFAAADARAIAHQRRTYRALASLLWLVGLATLAFAVYGDLSILPENRRVALLAAYIGLLAFADLLFIRTRWLDSQNRFQDYRALAEGLRVQRFWRMGGLPHSAADHYLRKQRDALSWIREALRACALDGGAVRTDLTAVRQLWIADQQRYYERAAARDRRMLARRRWVASAFILASLLVTMGGFAAEVRGRWWLVALVGASAAVLALHLGLEIGQGRHARRTSAPVPGALAAPIAIAAALVLIFLAALFLGGPWLARHDRGLAISADVREWWFAAIGLSAVIGTLLHAHAQQRALSEHEKQFAQMADLFARAGTRFDAQLAAGSVAGAQALLLDLGREALTEHADWLLLHRDRPLELPSADL